MEARFQHVFLSKLPSIRYYLVFITAMLVLCWISFSAPVAAQPAENTPELTPKLERQQVFDRVLDTEDFDIGVQTGFISIEDFENSNALFIHSAFHITEHFYAKARYWQAQAGFTSFEKFSNTSPLLTEQEREMKYFGLNLGYNLFPGEVYIARGLAFNSALSFELGGGTTEFAGKDNFTVNVGSNFRIYLTDWLTWDLAVTDYFFESSLSGESKTTHNLAVSTGFAVFF